MGMGFGDLLEVEKRVRPTVGWRPEDAGGMLRWRGLLDVAGATIEGGVLHVRTRASEPGRDVSFMLEVTPAFGSSALIDRIDWNPIEPHANKGVGRDEIKFLVITGSHRHSYYENRTRDGAIRSGNLPVAIPVERALPNFGSLLAFVSETYKIVGLENLQPPPWSEDLFR